MPLESGPVGSAAFKHNIATEINAGKPPKQAEAIAYSKARGDMQPTEFDKLKSLLNKFLNEESEEPEHKKADADRQSFTVQIKNRRGFGMDPVSVSGMSKSEALEYAKRKNKNSSDYNERDEPYEYSIKADAMEDCSIMDSVDKIKFAVDALNHRMNKMDAIRGDASQSEAWNEGYRAAYRGQSSSPSFKGPEKALKEFAEGHATGTKHAAAYVKNLASGAYD